MTRRTKAAVLAKMRRERINNWEFFCHFPAGGSMWIRDRRRWISRSNQRFLREHGCVCGPVRAIPLTLGRKGKGKGMGDA